MRMLLPALCLFLFFRLTLIDDEMVEPLISVWGLQHKIQ